MKPRHPRNLSFYLFSLLIVGLGAGFAIGASLGRLIRTGDFPLTTFIVAILALIVAYPVYQQYLRMKKLNDQQGFV